MSKQTPMMEQYHQIKADYPDAFLFYRVGDFYELFEDDAVKGAQLLELTLTKRSHKTENQIPMAGVPHQAVDTYVNQLVEKGYKVAICEQLEDPSLSQGMVKRGVIQLITPGTLMAQDALEGESNYLVSVKKEATGYGLAYCDLSTGEVFATHLLDLAGVKNELLSLRTKEVVTGDLAFDDFFEKANIIISHPIELTEKHAEISYVTQKLTDELEISAAEQLISYLIDTQKRSLAHLQPAISYEVSQYLQMSHLVQSNLELVRSQKTGKKIGSLFWVLDKTQTAMGGRLLKQWLSRPLLETSKINDRQEMVQALFDNFFLREQLLDSLKGIYDLERLTGRAAFGNINARELLQLANSLKQVPEILAVLENSKIDIFTDFAQKLDPMTDLADKISQTLVENPPILTNEGGLIRDGVDSQLDRYREAMSHGQDWLAEMEQTERAATGIENLKVGYNKVFGYYLQVTNSNKDKVPDRYTRKQTLTNAERYITPELKEHENLIMEAKSRSTELEHEIFLQLREMVKQDIAPLQVLGNHLASLDVFCSFAQVAEDNHYVRPSFHQERKIKIIKGRHPVVEKVTDDYIPNDVKMGDQTSIYLITGPNMSGKSTYMRQLALIVIMAQVGSFVPAESCQLPIFDQIFTRIGAADDLMAGQSTFMVEMSEANEALKRASERSLILFDEIGRGTATYDGMSLAGAIIRYLHDYVGAKTLFATHYHELTDMADTLEHLENIHVGATEENGKLIFLHQIMPGPADQSYGIHVAQLAGLPTPVLKEAKKMLNRFESDSQKPAPVEVALFDEPSEVKEVDPQQDEILSEIKNLYLNEETPLDVMQKVASWQKMLKESKND